MKILITGSAGFIGFHICNALLANNKNFVYGIDNLNDYYDVDLKKKRLSILKKKYQKNFKFQKIDLIKKTKLEKFFSNNKFEYVIHLAAQAGVRYSISHPEEYIKSNVDGFFNILDLSKKKKIKHFLYASTSSVYGKKNLKKKLSESNPVDHPIQLYAATKRANELMAHSYSSLYNLPTTGLRFFTVYGPWGRPDMSLFKFTQAIFKGEHINIFNKGNHVRDFTYIDDVVNIVCQLVNKIPKSKKTLKPFQSTCPFRILNVGTDRPIKLLEFIKIIEKKTKKKARKNFVKLQKGDVIKTQCDISQLKKLVKIKKTSISLGISKFIDWYKELYVI